MHSETPVKTTFKRRYLSTTTSICSLKSAFYSSSFVRWIHRTVSNLFNFVNVRKRTKDRFFGEQLLPKLNAGFILDIILASKLDCYCMLRVYLVHTFNLATTATKLQLPKNLNQMVSVRYNCQTANFAWIKWMWQKFCGKSGSFNQKYVWIKWTLNRNYPLTENKCILNASLIAFILNLYYLSNAFIVARVTFKKHLECI